MARGDYSQLYGRIEKAFNVDEISAEVIEAWLIQGKEGGKIKYGFDKSGKQRYVQSKGISSTGRTNVRIFAEGLSRGKEIYDEVDVEGEIGELKNLRKEAESLDIYSTKVVEKIDEGIEIAKEVKIQEKEILEKESGDFLIKEYKEAETVEERKEARRTLREELPYSLRSLKGWETRRGKEAFRLVFEE